MQKNWNLIGHQWAVDLLKAQIANHRVRHAYLFTGPEGVGRRTLALRLAQAVNCANPPAPGEFCMDCRACRGFAKGQHTDLFIVERQEGDRDIKVDAVRELSRGLALTPFEAKFQIALLLDFEQASQQGANALLKTLEEPNPSVIICLTARDVDSLPETIVSRCEVVRLRALAADELAQALNQRSSIEIDRARLLAGLGAGCPGLALRLHEQPDQLAQRTEWLDQGAQLLAADRVQRFAYADRVNKERETLRALLMVWLSFWRDVMLRSAGSEAQLTNPDRSQQIQSLAARLPLNAAHRAVTAVELTLEQLNVNVNARLAMEALLLQLPSL